MKRLLIMTLAMTGSIVGATAHETKAAHKHAYNEIHTDQLKAWYDQGKTMIVLDARTKPYFEGTLLPDAQWLPADSQEKDITAALPAKDSVIVVYCAGKGCPASSILSDKLAGMGYTNVYEYPEGINEWIKKGYSTVRQK